MFFFQAIAVIDYTNEVNSTACDDTNDCVPLGKIWKML